MKCILAILTSIYKRYVRVSISGTIEVSIGDTIEVSIGSTYEYMAYYKWTAYVCYACLEMYTAQHSE